MNKRTLTTTIFIVATVGIGWLIGSTNLPGSWYASLQKPSFNPPSWVFGPVWTVLYVMIAMAGARTWLREDNLALAMIFWIGQMVLNYCWSPVVFSLQNLALGLAVIIGMLIFIVGFIVVSWRGDRVASWLFMPYAAWAAFASTLNFALWRLN